MNLFEFLGKLDESNEVHHFNVANEGSELMLLLEIDGGFYARYNVKLRLTPRGSWEAFGLPDGNADALIEAYELAERHGHRKGDDYTFALDDLVDLINEVR